jgi:chromosome segregation ATPase
MKRVVAWTILLAAAANVAPAVAQTPAAAEASALGALLTEVRLLRQAIERQSTMTSRAQLLIGKLALQDQRVMRWQAETQRLESDVAGMAAARNLTQARLAEMRNTLQHERDPERVQALEQEARMIEAQVKQSGAQHAALEARRAEAAQALDAERARYDELSDRLERLERELDKPSR